jgi:hypothetical protein
VMHKLHTFLVHHQLAVLLMGMNQLKNDYSFVSLVILSWQYITSLFTNTISIWKLIQTTQLY